MFPAMVEDMSTLQCYEKGFTKRRSARTDREIVYIDSTDSRDNISNVIFSPNKVQFSVNLNKETIIVLNQNYDKANFFSKPGFPTNNYQGKVAVYLSAGSYENVFFSFWPSSLTIGLCIFISYILIILTIIAHKHFKLAFQKPKTLSRLTTS